MFEPKFEPIVSRERCADPLEFVEMGERPDYLFVWSRPTWRWPVVERPPPRRCLRSFRASMRSKPCQYEW
jgi:hypothetical protein